MNNGTLSRVEFTTADLAAEMGCLEQQVKVSARKLQISAPFTATEAEQIKAELNPTAPQTHGEIIEAGERFEDAIAPLDDESPNDLYTTARAAFKRALVERLKSDYNSIESEAITEILGNE